MWGLVCVGGGFGTYLALSSCGRVLARASRSAAPASTWVSRVVEESTSGTCTTRSISSSYLTSTTLGFCSKYQSDRLESPWQAHPY